MISTAPIKILDPNAPVARPPQQPFATVGLIQIPNRPPRLVCLVTPRHVVSALHYEKVQSSVGEPVMFSTDGGMTKTMTKIKRVAATYQDLVVLELEDLIGIDPTQICTFTDITKDGSYIVTGLENLRIPIAARATFRLLQTAQSGSAQVSFKQTAESTIRDGDSGSPVFVNISGQLKLVGTIYSVLPTTFYVNAAYPWAEKIAQL